MKPTDFKGSNVVFAKDQPEYQPLPAFIDAEDRDGTVVMCWKMTFWERLRILFTGRIWISVLTFRSPLQPIYVAADKSEVLHVQE